MRGENMPPAASTNSVQDIEITRHESVAEAVQLANTSNASNLHTINAMEKLEIEGKTIEIQAKRKQQAIEIHAMQQEQRLKDYQAYCGLLKDKTDHDFIAQCFPTLVFFFKKEDFEEAKYREYVKLYNDSVKKTGIYEPMCVY
jgi:hypothetical protein